ncbi:MAG TPA: AMIN domain-containing protein, partial [Terriglobales bacterium]|nr:AMIN domain-containing protein [Terriglobales bacterium]
MKTSSTWARAFTAGLLLTIAVSPGSSHAQTASVDRVAVVGNDEGLGIQISTNGPVTTEAQILSNPDRLVIDFPGALPGRALRGIRPNQGEIRAVRAGLWRSDPPVTRVVIDLNQATGYRLVPGDRAILVRLGTAPMRASAESVPGVSIERHPTARALAALTRSPEAPLRVGFDRGLLTISARKATLADVLYQVHLRTGADIPIPSGAEQEQVAIQAGPGTPKDVIAALLNGSRFNYVLQGTAQDPQGVGAVILTPKANISE